MAHNSKFTALFVNYITNIQRSINKIFSHNDIMQEAFTRTYEADIKEQASLWLSKVKRGLSKEEKLSFQKWVKQSDFHRSSLSTLAPLCEDSRVLNKLSALFPINKPLPQQNNLMTKYAIAASVAFILLFTGNLFINKAPFTNTNNEQQFVEVKTLQTAIGQQTRFSLSDGSRIKLNTNSLVQVSFSKKSRLLNLIKGEANFDVAKDKSRPFTVTVGDNSFTALGTIFNVQKTSNKDMELVVTEGRVLITKFNEPLTKVANKLAILSKEELLGLVIASGEIATIENNIQTSHKKASFEQIQQELSWQQGMLVFNGEQLDEALTEISRYTTTKFEINNVEITKIKVAGYFKANDIDGLIESLSNNFNIQFEKVANNTIRLSLNSPK